MKGPLLLMLCLPGLAEELVHDPSRITTVGQYECVWWSGRGGAELKMAWRQSESEVWTEGPPIDIDPAWVIEEYGDADGECDAPGVLDAYIYYTVFDEGDYPGGIQDGIGLMRRAGAAPPFAYEDLGVVIRSYGESDHPRAMDPSPVLAPDGAMWMTFGSYAGGIYLVQLNPETGLMQDFPDHVWCNNPEIPHWQIHPERFRKLAAHPGFDGGDPIVNEAEASFLYCHPTNGWWYLFMNWGACCDGADSTYEIRVGRSATLAGPYLDRDGVDLLDGGGTLVLDQAGEILGNPRFIGPGHAGLWVDPSGRHHFTFHYYDGADNGTSKLGEILMTFPDGWPEPWLTDCPSDVNGDQLVGVDDVLAVLAAFGTDDPTGDINADGVADVNDILQVVGDFGQPCP